MAWIKMKGNTFKPIDINSWSLKSFSGNYRYCGYSISGTTLKAWGGGEYGGTNYAADAYFKTPSFSKLKGKVIHTKLSGLSAAGYIYGDLMRVRDDAIVVPYFFNTYTGATTPADIVIPDDDEYYIRIRIYAWGGGTYFQGVVTVNSMYIDKK